MNYTDINQESITVSIPDILLDNSEIKRMVKRNQGIPANYKEGESQEVYPFKDKTDIAKMKEYFLNRSEWRNYALFVIGINIGLRAGDLVKLKVSDVLNKDNSIVDSITIFEEKTKKKRLFFLNDSVKTALTFYLEKTQISKGYLFKSRESDFISVRAFGLILKTAAQNVGIQFNVGTHSLRKTFGYHQFLAHNKDNMFLAELQDMFGHSSPKITLRYIGMEAEKFKAYYNDVCL